jgi:amidophosphoribosyltransferase
MAGIFGAWSHNLKVAELVLRGISTLQHRGDDVAGVVVNAGGKLRGHKGIGMVKDVLRLNHLYGNIALGHVKNGYNVIDDVEPFCIRRLEREIAVAFDGALVEHKKLVEDLADKGAIFKTSLDSELILHLLSRSKKKTLEEALIEALRQIGEAYALVLITSDRMIGARSPLGFCPLSLGKLNGMYFLSSETCVFNVLGAKLIKEIEPGEMISISDKDGDCSSYKILDSGKADLTFRRCFFELIYHSRPDSVFAGQEVSVFQRTTGRLLAQDLRAGLEDIDLVMAVPDSANFAGLGFSEESRIPFNIGLIRSHNACPGETLEDKFSVVKSVVGGKRIFLIDDSLIEGIVAQKFIKMLREAGVREIHLRIASPSVVEQCKYGIQMPPRKNLIALRKTYEEIRKFVGADSFEYLSLERMRQCVKSPDDFCADCFRDKLQM